MHDEMLCQTVSDRKSMGPTCPATTASVIATMQPALTDIACFVHLCAPLRETGADAGVDRGCTADGPACLDTVAETSWLYMILNCVQTAASSNSTGMNSCFACLSGDKRTARWIY